jgi:serine/threonine protein kinase
MADFRREVDMLCRLRHPNVVLFLGACTKANPTIVMEHLSKGTLANVLSDVSVPLDYELKLNMLMDVARGMNYLHKCKPPIIHRDLKTENLMVDENWIVKVVDFGLAKSHSSHAKTNCGTVGYCAPEVMQSKPYTRKADVYPYGVVLWEMHTREIPYQHMASLAVVRAIDLGETLPVPANTPVQYSELMHDCWKNDPSLRPDFNVIMCRLEWMLANPPQGLNTYSSSSANHQLTDLYHKSPAANADNERPRADEEDSRRGTVMDGSLSHMADDELVTLTQAGNALREQITRGGGASSPTTSTASSRDVRLEESSEAQPETDVRDQASDAKIPPALSAALEVPTPKEMVPAPKEVVHTPKDFKAKDGFLIQAQNTKQKREISEIEKEDTEQTTMRPFVEIVGTNSL